MHIHLFKITFYNGNCGRSACVELDEFIQRFRLRISVLKHPEKVLEQNNLACHVDGVIIVVLIRRFARPIHQLPEEWMSGDVGAHEVSPPRLADENRTELRSRWRVAVVGDGADGGAAVLAITVAEGVPFLEH
ncbi:hypothetical protein SESBI_03936 [Sesbania bispinosa]|nr:hypothetical protein SESBI_03936 [Sesbania bispinosa]